MFLESLSHDASSFITLTYSDTSLPPGYTLVPKHVTDWLKRLRKAISPHRVRYFLCGEYGDRTLRPHYHACLFGLDMSASSVVQTTWGHGFTLTAEFNQTTAQYVAGYVIKKMTSFDHPALNGRHPEFARMSRRPGIGAPAMAILADTLHSRFGLDEIAATGDVPIQLAIGRKKIPLGRYLRSVLRDEMGFTDEMVEQVKARFFSERSQEVLTLLSSRLSDPSFTGGAAQALVEDNLGSIRSIEARSKLGKGRSL